MRIRKANAKSGNEALDRALHVWRDMQRGISLSVAAHNNGVKVGTVRKYLGSALRQDRPGGRIHATKSHRIAHYLQIPGQDGPIEIKIRGSKQATEVAKYKSAVNRFLGDKRNALANWHDKKIGGIELITDESTLKKLAQKDLLPYSLYRSLSGGAA